MKKNKEKKSLFFNKFNKFVNNRFFSNLLFIFLGILIGISLSEGYYFFKNLLAQNESTYQISNNISIVFSPNSKSIILNFLDSAEESIDIEMYSITSDDVVEKLIELKKRKVKVRIILDVNIDAYERKLVEKLKKFNIHIKFLDLGKYVMHSKFIVIDKKKVLVGSINLSEAALKGNREAAIIIVDEKVGEKFNQIFEKDFEMSNYDYKIEEN
ncbi:MAG: phospholipase D-like domain-containing protein [Candidatus Anstonellales archaeon]